MGYSIPIERDAIPPTPEEQVCIDKIQNALDLLEKAIYEAHDLGIEVFVDTLYLNGGRYLSCRLIKPTRSN